MAAARTHQPDQQGHPDGHVVGLEHRDLLGPLDDGLELRLRVPGGGRHQGEVPGHAVVHQCKHARVVGKVDDRIRRAGVVGQAGRHPSAPDRSTRAARGVALRLDQAADLLAHPAQGAVDDKVHSAAFLSQTERPRARIRWSMVS